MLDRKRILFLTNRLPYPPDKGEKIRTYHQLRQLAARHDVYCACFIDSPNDQKHLSAVSKLCSDAIAIPWRRPSAAFGAGLGLLAGRSLSESAFRSRRLFAELRRLSNGEPFDAAVAFSSSMASYALAVPARRRILDLCDADSEKWFDYARMSSLPSSWLYRTEGRRLFRHEQRAIRAFDETIVITERERRAIDPEGAIQNIHVVPNGVQLTKSADRRPWERGPVVGFVGSMNYRPNADAVCWFVEHCWPTIIRRMPAARLLIIGRNPTQCVKRLGLHSGVTVTGQVPDVQKQLLRCRVIVAPLRIARGLPNKVLEAMAAARPVVATSAVAETMSVCSTRNILITDRPTAMVRCVLALLDSDALCRRIGEAGYRFAAIHHCWAEAMQRFERIVLGESPPRSQKLPLDSLIHKIRIKREALDAGLDRTKAPPAALTF